MYNLAICYCNGYGTEKNLEKVSYWLQKILEKDFYFLQKMAENAEYGNMDDAMFNLAKYYGNGFGTEKNLEKAFYWFQKAAEHDNEKAINSLVLFYYNGFGTEKNLEEAFYWLQKMADNGNDIAMGLISVCYKYGTGTEKNLEKAFYWCQKAANYYNIESMRLLAKYYYKGEGIEKNLEEAFYWFQKAAEMDHIDSQFILTTFYFFGKETERDLEKAFYWCQRPAEMDHIKAQVMLSIFYLFGMGTECDLEKAFYWCQKAAKHGDDYAIESLVTYYKYGIGTEKNLEKAFYWYYKGKENNINYFNNDELCKECKQSHIDYNWCQQCNTIRFQLDFSKWTSKNEVIDKFIQEAQLNAKNSYEVLEWIPYNKLKNIIYHDKGGFSEIRKAIWLEGPIDSWDSDKQQWNRWNSQIGYEVILKNLNNSSSLNDKFLSELKYHYNCQKKSFSKFIRYFGITQDPNNLNYMMVMSYAKDGSLRKCLSNIVKLEWQHKLLLLKNIILGLKVIHESGLAHCDLHDGNILISDLSDNYEAYIIDLGLCKPISDLQNSIDSNYGVLPYIAPEVLRNKPYTLASDIYSFSMIMWEFTSGIPPFNNRVYDHELTLRICKGERPEIIKHTPDRYIDLMKKCWDSEPSKRPTIIDLENIISKWLKSIKLYSNFDHGKESGQELSDNIDCQRIYDICEFIVLKHESVNIKQFNPQVYMSQLYKSQLLTENFRQNSDCSDCAI
ncbi:kinase-like domain-containing protein [Glomus cerebriforme]|uniref:Kinase-like domain-containing protein n=1 Tax=Glomus cerebriforme TaxID=658196 RepID=A0A397S5S6_9GLOM|nr:kinase-like domain-containing protein [Glomus cerebriforme]